MGVPVIDLSGLGRGGGRASEVGREIDEACRSVGFFSVIGHGIDAAVIERAHDAAIAFFDLPPEARLGAAKPSPDAPYGYVPFSAEALNRSIGGTGPPDLKETYNVGPVGTPPRPPVEMVTGCSCSWTFWWTLPLREASRLDSAAVNPSTCPDTWLVYWLT